jgi:phage protein D
MTEALLTATAPIFEIDGQVRGELARDILRLEIGESTDGLKTLSARFLAHGPSTGESETLLYLDGSLFDFGKTLAVSLGPGESARTVFRGVVSGLELDLQETREPEVVIFAEDALMQLRMTRRMKTYENMTDAQIAEAVAIEHHLAVQTDADGPTYDVVQQFNMSDLAFLRERAQLIQAEIWVQDDTLHFKTRDKRAATEITLVQGNHILDLQVRADLAHQRTAVKVSGYDAALRKEIVATSGAEAIQAEVAGELTGPAILQRAFGERVSYRVRETPLLSGEAAAWARAEMLRRSRRFVTVVGNTRGAPDLIVGSRLRLERVGQPFDGPGYYVTHVCHTYDLTQGYRTRFEAERGTLQEAA